MDKQVPDSAGTATAYLCGVKANYYTLGVDPEVTLGDCAAARNPIYHTPSILQWAQEAGKDTGEHRLTGTDTYTRIFRIFGDLPSTQGKNIHFHWVKKT